MRDHLTLGLFGVVATGVASAIVSDRMRLTAGLDATILAGVIGGAAGVVLVFVLMVAWSVFLTPTAIWREQQAELGQVPVKVQGDPLGILDFAHDVEESISSDAITKYIKAIGDETRRAGEAMGPFNTKLTKAPTAKKRRKLAIRLASRLDGHARKLRKIHARFKRAEQDFSMSFRGYMTEATKQIGAEQRASHRVAVAGATVAVQGMKDACAGSRKAMKDLFGAQQHLGASARRIEFVVKDIEKTTGRLLSTLQFLEKLLAR